MYEQIARYYDLTHAELKADLNYVLALAQEAGDAVLELGCGSGRLLLSLAQAGCAITGVDNSPAMLALAQAKLAALPSAVQERVTLVEADMSALALPEANGRFALALIPYNTFMHLDGRQALQALKGIRPLLAENGRLFIDLANPFVVANTPDEPALTLERIFTDEETDRTVVQLAANHIDHEAQTLRITWLYDASPPAGGPVQRTVAQMRYHYRYPHQLELLLAGAGFKLESLNGDYDGASFDEESERLLVLARLANSEQ